MKHTITIITALLLTILSSSVLATDPEPKSKRQLKKQEGIQRAYEIMKSGRFFLSDSYKYGYDTDWGFNDYFGYYFDDLDTTLVNTYEKFDTIQNAYQRGFVFRAGNVKEVTLYMNSGYVRIKYPKGWLGSFAVMLGNYKNIHPYPFPRPATPPDPQKVRKSYDLLQSGSFQIRMPGLSNAAMSQAAWTIDKRNPSQRPVSTECDTVAKVYTATYITDSAAGISEKLTFNYHTGALRIDSYVGDSVEMIQVGNYRQISRAPRRP